MHIRKVDGLCLIPSLRTGDKLQEQQNIRTLLARIREAGIAASRRFRVQKS
jgi:hypothetical protein